MLKRSWSIAPFVVVRLTFSRLRVSVGTFGLGLVLRPLRSGQRSWVLRRQPVC
jgi:hypothetical protein